MAAARPGHDRGSDLLSLEELAASLASLEDGRETAADAAVRQDIFRRQLSRALTERHSDLLAQIRRPSDHGANSEQLEGLRSQLLGALLERTVGAAVDGGLAGCEFDSSGGSTANGLAWAISHAAGGGGGFGGGGRGAIDVAQLLAANTRLRAFAPTYKRKHEGTDLDALALASRPKQAQRHEAGAEPPADQPAPAPLADARDADYDGDDDDDDGTYAPTMSYVCDRCDAPPATWPPASADAADVRMSVPRLRERGADARAAEGSPPLELERLLSGAKTQRFDGPRSARFAESARADALPHRNSGDGGRDQQQRGDAAAAAAAAVAGSCCHMDVE